MKYSIAISFLILALGATLGWRDHGQVTREKKRQTELVAEATRLGLAADQVISGGETGRAMTKRDRDRGQEDAEAKARAVAAGFIAFGKEMEEAEKKGEPPGEEAQKRFMKFLDEMMSLTPAQLKIVVAEFRATKDLSDELRRNLMGISIMGLSADHPQAALALLLESGDLAGDEGIGNQVVETALANWAKTDPMGALKWVKENGEKYPDAITDDTKQGLIKGAAANDPKLAFQLIGELGIKDTRDAIRTVTEAAHTGNERTATLTALRGYLTTLTDDKARREAGERGLSSMAGGVAKEGFGPATAWLAGAKLSPEELAAFSSGLGRPSPQKDTGLWIEWVGEHVPADKIGQPVKRMIRDWTQKDYQAAGTWLAAAPAGPAKTEAVRGYVETIANYEPETAEQWAMTLPAGESREDSLKKIYDNWPKKDDAGKAAAEVFAEKHGIKK